MRPQCAAQPNICDRCPASHDAPPSHPLHRLDLGQLLRPPTHPPTPHCPSAPRAPRALLLQSIAFLAGPHAHDSSRGRRACDLTSSCIALAISSLARFCASPPRHSSVWSSLYTLGFFFLARSSSCSSSESSFPNPNIEERGRVLRLVPQLRRRQSQPRRRGGQPLTSSPPAPSRPCLARQPWAPRSHPP